MAFVTVGRENTADIDQATIGTIRQAIVDDRPGG
jgi:hypothetical protein